MKSVITMGKPVVAQPKQSMRMVLKPRAQSQPAAARPAGPPIGTGFMPDSNVTIHKKQV